jgi:hypothetical protein
MQKVQVWSPDTCGCVIVQAWDTDVPGVVTPLLTWTNPETGKVYNRHACAEHAGLITGGGAADPEVQYQPVQGDNTRKNRILQRAKELLGVETMEELRAIVTDWYFVGTDGGRVLHIVWPSITAGQRTTAENWIAVNHPGRIVID